MVHAVVPQQPIPASRAAEVLAEKRIDIGALDEELAQPKNRCPSVAGRSVVPTSARELAQRIVGLVREVNLARSRVDQPCVHLEVARDEAVEHHRRAIGMLTAEE